MKGRTLLGITLVLLLSVVAFAAGPMPDTIKVNFPFPVVVGQLTLPPGAYEFQRENENLPANFRIYNADGKVLGLAELAEAEQVGPTAAAIDVPQKNEVVVDEINGKYYLDTFYLQGEKRAFRFAQADAIRRQLEKAGKSIHEERIEVQLTAPKKARLGQH